MATNTCPGCGSRGKPKVEDGYLICSHCGTCIGEKEEKPNILWAFLLAIVAILFGSKKEVKKSRKKGRRKKKAVSFKRAYITQMTIVSAVVLGIYYLNKPYSDDVGALLIGLEYAWVTCLVLCAFSALLINDMSKPIFDIYEDED
jgi:divalent metal cation (Fe/Co/Zn/Cd) transporter